MNRKVVAILLLFIVISLACTTSSFPSQYVYSVAGTDTPVPTNTMPPPDPPDYSSCDRNETISCNDGVTRSQYEICQSTVLKKICGPARCSQCEIEPTPRPTYTPYPTPTPYVQKYIFYKTQVVNVNGIVLRFDNATQRDYRNKNYYVLYFTAWNKWGGDITITYPINFYIREVYNSGDVTLGHWGATDDAVDLIGEIMSNELNNNEFWNYVSDDGQLEIKGGHSVNFVAVVEAPHGTVYNFLLDPDPMSSDKSAYLIFKNALPPDRCASGVPTSPDGCHYHAETDPSDYSGLQEPPGIDYYTLGVDKGGSSQNYYSPSQFSENDPGSIVFYAPEEFYSGPTSQVMPLGGNLNITQNYGCTNYSNKNGVCVYYQTTDSCDTNIPKCIDPNNKNRKTWGFHSGLDLATTLNTPIYATDGGVVVKMTCLPGDNSVACQEHTSGYGRLMVIASAEKGYCYYYAHMNGYPEGMSVGMTVQAGQNIGFAGTTGGSSGVHLHYEIRKYNNGACHGYVSPETYLGVIK